MRIVDFAPSALMTAYLLLRSSWTISLSPVPNGIKGTVAPSTTALPHPYLP
jgi:hypothetical protein